MDCPDEIELARFVARTLDGVRARALEDHFDRCRECRQLAFALAASDPALETPGLISLPDDAER